MNPTASEDRGADHPPTPTPAPSPPRAWVWSTRQRAALGVVVLGVVAGLAVRAYLNPLHLPDPPAPAGPLADQLDLRVDPNEADWPALAALPSIGEKRAREIVEYRRAYEAEHEGAVAFKGAEDLMNVKGIGKATTRALEPHLVFPPAGLKGP